MQLRRLVLDHAATWLLPPLAARFLRRSRPGPSDSAASTWPTKPGLVVLDLGRECTVAGMRIWNLNEPSGTHRGWKETTIYVGSSPTPLATPAVTGIVPPAPGTANAPDYSTTIPVPFVRGRYVRLQANSVWRQDDHIGLTEVQVLGYQPPPAP